MGVSISIPLKKNANKEKIMEVFNVFPYVEQKKYIYMSDDPEEHTGVNNLTNGFYYSRKSMPFDVDYYLNYFCSIVVSKFGRKKKCKLNNKSYPYYFEDFYVIFVIPEEDEEYFKENINFGDGISYNVAIEPENTDLFRNRPTIKEKYSHEELKDYYGDNDLLKINCITLSKLLNAIN